MHRDIPNWFERDRGRDRPRLRTRLFLGGVLAGSVIVSACGDDDADADPAATVEAYRDSYNSGDLDAVMELFSAESVISGHPVIDEATGLLEIRNLHDADLGSAAAADAYEFSNVEVSGDNVSWDHVWTSREGTDWCANGHSAVIEGDKIVTWRFAPFPGRCG